MKHFIQFKTLSTGYISGTIPPQFSDEYIKPINKLGSDGVFYLDNRLNLDSMIDRAIDMCKSRNNKIGFSICKYGDSILNSKEVYTLIFK